MSDDFKSTVSRTLTTENRQYTNVVWQAGKPPLDSELNLVGQIATDNLATTVSTNAHSGVLFDPRSSMRDFSFNPLWSNYMKVKGFKAIVNGLIVNVEETNVNLPPPPASDSRVDFVFLEVWKGILSADNSGGDLSNKSSGTEVYSNGRIGGSGLPDEMVDGNVGFETTKRIQVQYRFRVVSGVNLKDNLEGMESPLVYAQGPLAQPTNNVSFSNQHLNGDAGLWVAHMTDDGTATGSALSNLLSENIVYALPICAVSRRNNKAYVAFDGANNANQNGAPTRTPSSNSATDAVGLTQATLSSALTSSFTGDVTLLNGDGSGLNDNNLYGGDTYLVIGNGLNQEVVKVSTYTSPNTLTITERGKGGTQAKYHPANSEIKLFNGRPDGKYSDEIHPNDLFDMRHATTLGEWDYQSLLESSLSNLIFNNLHTSYKQNQQNSTCAGTIIEEVSILNDVANPAQVFEMDLPNGFRDTWSDGVIPQTGITLYLEPTAIGGDGVSTVNLNVPDAGDWEIAPDLSPTAFLFDTATPTLKAGSWIKLNLDLTSSNLGYGVNHSKSPATISEAGIRMIAPREVKDPTTKRPPITIEELGEYHKPLLYPRLENNYEKPFIVLGKEKHTATFLTNISGNATDKNYYQLYAPTAYNNSEVYDVNGTLSYDGDLVIAVRLGLSGIDTPVEINNLEYLVTDNGKDTSGDSSSLYAVIYGDPANQSNNGVFKVIDILNSGTVSSNVTYYNTFNDPTNLWAPTSFVGFIILKPVDNINRAPGLFDATNLNIEFRTQELTDQDDNVMIAITESTTPDLGNDIQGQLHTTGEFQLSVSVLYPPSTGGIANVANNIHKIGLTPPASGEFLNVSKSVIHGAGFATLPLVENEIDLPTQNHISLWNRLPSSNLPIGVASSTSMGGRVINEEADREAEAFTDEKSKTLVLRPFQKKGLILNKATTQTLTTFNGVSTPLVPATWSDGRNVDSPTPMFLSSKDAAYVLPEAMMPRFGRQDIPLHTRTGSSDQFYSGLNHLFIDDPSSTTDNVFTIIGGRSNTGSPGVNNALFVTGVNYGERTTHPEINSKIGTGARKKTLNVPTSDFGSTTKGIELPPYYGIARVYGVYERGLFDSELAQTDNLGGHQNNRINTKDLSDCPNLLRTDTSSFTMYINQNGGNDHVSGYSNAHTYVLTEHAIDISRLEGTTAGWTDASTFDDFDYVVECVVFMFADGFISHNRYVLPREYNGGGIQQDNTSPSKLVIDAVIPFAPPISSAITVAYSRTPYQGDPFNTLLQGTDQVVPQGRKSLADLTLGTKSQPVSLNGTNKRDVEVLASMDFYTTLGTGKIGGRVYPTTITDVGFTPFPPNRDPSSLSGTHISLRSSTFTEESSQRGGWSTLFLFAKGANTTTNATVKLYKNGVSIYSKSLTGLPALATQVPDLQTEIQALGFNCFQVRGEFQQENVANQSYLGIMVQAPNPTDSFELEVDWKNLKNGQNIQVFEGMREVPMSFQLWSQVLNENTEHLNNNRSKSKVSFSSVVANAINAGDGNTPLSLTGMTSRLPLGSLVRDSDFICEDILNNSSSYLFSSTGSFSTISNPVPVSPNGVPYTQTLGISGDLLQLTDGKITNLPSPALQPKYTIARGGGAVFGVGGDVPGGPLSFLATSFGKSDQPVLKGSALACRAMLVRNFYEEDESLNPKSYGDELQLVIVSHAVDGNGGGAITLGGDISPSGYGEGFSATDRFRIQGKPLAKIYGRKSDTEVAPAPYNS